MRDRLFVYGSLAPGQPNHHVLQQVPGRWEPATVRGRLVQHGWGAAIGFPALVLNHDGPEVRGLLFTSDMLSEHWAELDGFEGPAYTRVITRVRRETSDCVDAHVYITSQGDGCG